MRIVSAILMLAAVTALASSPLAAEPRIGVVNIARLLDESPQARSAMQALQDEFAPRQRDIVAVQEDVRTDEEKFERDRAVMGDAEMLEAERKLRDKKRELVRRQNEYLEDLNIRRNEELGRLQRSLMQEVQAFAMAKQYDLVIGDGVLYASASVDITADVLAGLESSFSASSSSSR